MERLKTIVKASLEERGSALLVSLMVIIGLSMLGLGFVAMSETESAIYYWNGLDQVPGAGKRQGRVERLLELAAVRGGTPEGLTVVAEREDYYEVIVVHDGIPGGHPLKLRVPRPR